MALLIIIMVGLLLWVAEVELPLDSVLVADVGVL
jgi:hypothetical protein